MSNDLEVIYQKLLKKFGPQYWWPAKTKFEVILGAILTQNTSWSNVEKAINNLKRVKAVTFNKLYKLREDKLAQYIRPAGYFNIKAKRLKNFLGYLKERYNGNFKKMFSSKLEDLRQELLCVNGIGPETADSILLYAGNYQIFDVDSYTKRIFSRHKFFKQDTPYQDVQKIFMRSLKNDARLFNEYHALIVKLAKEYCLKNNPKCQLCPLDAGVRPRK